MDEEQLKIINTAISTAVAIINLTDDEHIQKMAANIADTLIALTPVKDLQTQLAPEDRRMSDSNGENENMTPWDVFAEINEKGRMDELIEMLQKECFIEASALYGFYESQLIQNNKNAQKQAWLFD